MGRAQGGTWAGSPTTPEKTAVNASTHRGYTGHEQLDNLNLVHMKGRVYDPAIARFMPADPIILSPFRSQSFNRYSYVWNNPFSATDPTGLQQKCASPGSALCDAETNPISNTRDKGVSQNGQGVREETIGAPVRDAVNNLAQGGPERLAREAEVSDRSMTKDEYLKAVTNGIYESGT